MGHAWCCLVLQNIIINLKAPTDPEMGLNSACLDVILLEQVWNVYKFIQKVKENIYMDILKPFLL